MKQLRLQPRGAPPGPQEVSCCITTATWGIQDPSRGSAATPSSCSHVERWDLSKRGIQDHQEVSSYSAPDTTAGQVYRPKCCQSLGCFKKLEIPFFLKIGNIPFLSVDHKISFLKEH